MYGSVMTVKDAVIVLVGRVIQALSALVILRLMTTYFDAEAMGVFGIFTSLAMLFSLFFINPLWMYSYRHIHEWKQKSILWVKTLSIISVTALVATLALVTISTGFLFYKSDWTFSALGFSALVAAFIFVQNVNQTIIPFFNMLGHRLRWVTYNLLSIALGVVASVLLMNIEVRIEFWILGTVFGLLLGACIAAYDFFRLFGIQGPVTNVFFISAEERRQILLFCVPLAITVGLGWVQFQSYRFFLEGFASLELLGQFVTGYMVASGLLSAFETTVQQYFYPLLYRHVSDSDLRGQAQAWRSYASLMIPVFVFSAGALFVLAEPVVQLLLDQKFWGVVEFVRLGCAIELLRILGNVYGIGAHATKDTQILLVPQALGAVVVAVGVPLSFILGYNGLFAYVLVAAGLVYLLFMHLKIRSTLGASPNKFLLKFIFLSLPFLGLSAWVSSWELGALLSVILKFAFVGLGGFAMGFWLWHSEFWQKNTLASNLLGKD
jgi:O-antigen/teichoic acid export membrane protein